MNERDPSPTQTGPLLAAYYGTAVVAGVIVALNLIPFPIDLVVLLGLGLGATWIRYRMAGRDSLTSSLSWVALFVVVWLPLAWIIRRFPFGP
jgi:hypothetical protein